MSVLTDLSEGAAKGLFSGMGQWMKDARTAITGVDPEKKADLEMKLAELESKAEEFGVQFAKITEEDRDSARKREVDIAQAGKKNYAMPVLAALAVLGMAWLTYFTFSHDIRERELAFMIVGFAIAIVKDIYGYYFGSSAGSADKTDTINRITK